MAAFSTAILNQYWIGTLWPTICLSDQLNKNIDKIGCIEQVFYYYSIIVITFKRCMLLELVMSKFISEEIHPPSQKKKEERIEQNFYTTGILHILPFFPNFQLSKHPHASFLSEPYACHSYACQCLILCKFFPLWNLLHNLYRGACMLTKLTTNLNSIWSSLAYFCEIYGKVSLIKKQILLNLVRFRCLFKFCEINVVCYKDIKTNSN